MSTNCGARNCAKPLSAFFTESLQQTALWGTYCYYPHFMGGEAIT